jgi:hypothetical protein
MSGPILDAGPCLNFFGSNNERLLIRVVGMELRLPSSVDGEIRNKSRNDTRFTKVNPLVKKLKAANIITILDDDANDPALLRANDLVTGMPMAQVRKMARDLGETMVVIHAMKEALAGGDPRVVIDDRAGAELATAAQDTLARLRAEGQNVGTITLWGTTSILRQGVRIGAIRDKNEMRSIYQRLRPLSASLIPIQQTDLLKSPPWP